MSSASWNATIVDSPESEPLAVVGELVLAVRTPRSRDFVTVDVARTSRAAQTVRRAGEVVLAPKPFYFADQWHGEIHLNAPVSFAVEGSSYRLTLARLAENAAGSPWVTCDFLLERD